MEISISINPNEPCHLYDFGRWLKTHNEMQRGTDLIEQALTLWDQRLKAGRLKRWDYGWYSSALESVGQYSKAQEVRDANKTDQLKAYNTDNLTIIK